MPEYRRGVPPHTWPRQLPPPHDPELPLRVIGWLREALPSEEWRVEVLHSHPWELVTMGMTAIDRMIQSLRESHRETVRLYAGLLGPDDTRSLLDAHAQEAERLTQLRVQLAEVNDALFSAGRRSPK
jgi:hypothetical protein